MVAPLKRLYQLKYIKIKINISKTKNIMIKNY